MTNSKDFLGAGVLAVIGLGLLIWYASVHPAPHLNPAGSSTATTTNQTLSDHEQYYSIDAVYPASTPLLASAGANANAAAVQVMSDFVATTSAQFVGENNLKNLTPEDIAIQNLGGDIKYTLDISYDTYSSPHTLSYVFKLYEDTLGAHPNGYYGTFTFDSSTGAQLQLADLFIPNSNYLDALSSISRASLTATLGEDAVADFINPGTTPDAGNFSDFALDGSDLVIIFPPYAVGPYAVGTQTVRIPRAQLTTLLKAQYQ
jgi:hypothetical protein